MGLDQRPIAITCYVIGVVGIVAFLLAERPDGDDALLPLRLFRGRTFGVGSMLNFIVGMGMFGGAGAAAAVHADRQGLQPDRGRPAAAADGDRHHGRLDLSGQFIARTGRYTVLPGSAS